MNPVDALLLGLLIGFLLGFGVALVLQYLKPVPAPQETAQQPTEAPEDEPETRRPPRNFEKRITVAQRLKRAWTFREICAHKLGDARLLELCQKLINARDPDGHHYFVRTDYSPRPLSDTQYRWVRGVWRAEDLLQPGTNKRLFLSPAGLQFCSDIVSLVPEKPTTTHPPESGAGGLPEPEEGPGFHPYNSPVHV